VVRRTGGGDKLLRRQEMSASSQSTIQHFNGEGDETHLPRGACFQRDPLIWGDEGEPKTTVERG
jgi:hypothetical protein